MAACSTTTTPAALDSTISRLTSLSDSTRHAGELQLPGPGHGGGARPSADRASNLTYIKQTGESNGDAGDQYTGLDRFGRVVDQRWFNTSTSTATDRFQYGYDHDGNVLYQNNLVNTSFSELYHANGVGNGYDNLNQLTAFARGTLNGTQRRRIAGTVQRTARAGRMDALGNFTSVTTTARRRRARPTSRTRSRRSAAATLTYDGNGNLTTDETGNTLVYDAWNRLVAVQERQHDAGDATATTAWAGASRRTRGTAHRPVLLAASGRCWKSTSAAQAQVQYVWSPVYVDALVLRDRDPTAAAR